MKHIIVLKGILQANITFASFKFQVKYPTSRLHELEGHTESAELRQGQ